MGIILTLVALLFTIILLGPLLIYSLFRYSKFSYIFSHYLDIAKALDQFLNVAAKYFLNDTMIKKGGAEFGGLDETISSVIGKNYQSKTLTKFGMFWNNLLNQWQTNHTIDAIENDETNQIK